MCICLRIFFGIIIIDVFNDEESVILELKSSFLRTLFEWSQIIGSSGLQHMLDLLTHSRFICKYW